MGKANGGTSEFEAANLSAGDHSAENIASTEQLVQPDAGDHSAENISSDPVPCTFPLCGTRPHCFHCTRSAGDHSAENIGSDPVPCGFPFCGYQPSCHPCHPHAGDILI